MTVRGWNNPLARPAAKWRCPRCGGLCKTKGCLACWTRLNPEKIHASDLSATQKRQLLWELNDVMRRNGCTS